MCLWLEICPTQMQCVPSVQISLFSFIYLISILFDHIVTFTAQKIIRITTMIERIFEFCLHQYSQNNCSILPSKQRFSVGFYKLEGLEHRREFNFNTQMPRTLTVLVSSKLNRQSGFRPVNFSGLSGNSHVGPGLWPLQLHSQEQHRDSIPGVHSRPGWWVWEQFQLNKTDVFDFGSPPDVDVQSQESHASKKFQKLVTVSLLVLILTVIALFAIHSEINPTATTAGPLFSLA